MHVNHQVPSIIVYIEQNTFFAAEVVYGIEEEGIPYKVIYENFDNVIDKAYTASQESLLDVGIAYNKKGLTIHYEKLQKDAPMFYKEALEPKTIRALGSNAARLVKGVPFIEIG